MVWEIRRMTILKSIIKDRVEKRQQLPSECVLRARQEGPCVGKGEGARGGDEILPTLGSGRVKGSRYRHLQGIPQATPRR